MKKPIKPKYDVNGKKFFKRGMPDGGTIQGRSNPNTSNVYLKRNLPNNEPFDINTFFNPNVDYIPLKQNKYQILQDITNIKKTPFIDKGLSQNDINKFNDLDWVKNNEASKLQRRQDLEKQMKIQDNLYEQEIQNKMKEGKSGIHIDPKNKGKFNALKKRTGKSTEELTHSKNSLTRKRAIFAQNAKKWHHGEDGINDLPLYDVSMPNKISAPFDVNQQPTQNQGSNFNMNTWLNATSRVGSMANYYNQSNQPSTSQQIVGQFGPWGQAISQASQLITNNTKDSASYGTTTLNVMADPAALFNDKDLSQSDRIIGALNPIYGSKVKTDANRAKKNQAGKLSALEQQVKGLKEENPNRRYVRPEDQLFDPNQMYPTYGTGSNFLRKGGIVPYSMGGDIKTHWGGKAETVSVNPYLPYEGETVEFKGKSHEKGGIGMTFGNSPVEVEGGEPAIKLDNGGSMENLTVFGNMTIPDYGASFIGDKDAKGKKFKNYIKDLNRQETKQNKILDKGTNLVDSPVRNAFEKLKFSSGEANILGSNMKLKEIASKKETASVLQNSILSTAEELGKDPELLSKGILKKAKKGIFIDKADVGDELPGPTPQTASLITKDLVPKYQQMGYNFVEGDPTLMKLAGTNKTVRVSAPAAVSGGTDVESYKRAMKTYLDKGTSYEDLASKGHGTLQGLKSMFPGYDANSITTTPDDYVRIQDENKPKGYLPPNPPSIEPDQPNEDNGRGNSNWLNYAAMALPYIRPTNRSKFDPRQIAGEKWALEHNQLEPVQAQKYQPLLEQPYDISLQDQLNANQADFNSIRRLIGNNPSAQSVLAGQKYQANTGVLGEQFRINQANKAGVYNKNREILNDAQLKNLGILDQQYVRQTQAKSNTKAVTQAALNSISAKLLQHKLENQQLGIYENLYNYRYDNQGRAWNMNLPPIWNTDIQGSPTSNSSSGKPMWNTRTRTTYKDRLGMPKGYSDRESQTTKGRNGALVKAMKGANLKSYC